MRLKKLFLPLVIICAALCSCRMGRVVNIMQDSDRLPHYVDTLAYKDYILQRGDFLNVSISCYDTEFAQLVNSNVIDYATSDWNARLESYVIGEDSCINYPYIGKVLAAGLTTRQLKDSLQAKVREIVTDASLIVSVANRTFSIIGESGTGRYRIPKEKLTIYEALAMCGDLDLFARRECVKLIRQTENGTIVKTFDLRTKTIINSEYYYIQPNDVIYIPFSDGKYWGSSTVTGALGMTMTVISFGFSIYSAIHTVIQAASK